MYRANPTTCIVGPKSPSWATVVLVLLATPLFPPAPSDPIFPVGLGWLRANRSSNLGPSPVFGLLPNRRSTSRPAIVVIQCSCNATSGISPPGLLPAAATATRCFTSSSTIGTANCADDEIRLYCDARGRVVLVLLATPLHSFLYHRIPYPGKVRYAPCHWFNQSFQQRAAVTEFESLPNHRSTSGPAIVVVTKRLAYHH
jgi:hypothetical protein